ncbi:unnamed protein product [Knipowitschia caucasica]
MRSTTTEHRAVALNHTGLNVVPQASPVPGIMKTSSVLKFGTNTFNDDNLPPNNSPPRDGNEGGWLEWRIKACG